MRRALVQDGVAGHADGVAGGWLAEQLNFGTFAADREGPRGRLVSCHARRQVVLRPYDASGHDIRALTGVDRQQMR